MKKIILLSATLFLLGCGDTSNTTTQTSNTWDQAPTVDAETINKAYESQIKQNRYNADLKREIKDIEKK